MAGKIVKIASNDLYGESDDRKVSLYACFEHTKYMNNYVVFSILGEANKLYCGSIHLKEKSVVIFSVRDEIKEYISSFLDEYMKDKLENYTLIDIDSVEKVELVSYSEIDYDKLGLLSEKTIPKPLVIEEVKEKKPIFSYIMILLLVLFSFGLTLLYINPDLFSIKYNGLECTKNLYDKNIGLYYDIDKEIKFNLRNKVDSIEVVRTYTFLDSNSYYEFKDNHRETEYFTNGEGYKYIDNELQLRIFYQEDSVIDDYSEMVTYMNREGFSCVAKEYEV